MKGKFIDQAFEKIKVIERTQGYDARKKAYKDGERQIDAISFETEKKILELAIKKLGRLGYDFIYAGKTRSEKSPVGVLTYKDGFTLYLKPWFSKWGGRESSAHFAIYERLGRYSHALVGEKDLSNINKIINKQHKEYTERQRVNRVDSKNANDFYKQVKDDVTYKSYDYQDDEKWSGDKLETTWENPDDRFWKTARCETHFRDEKVEVSGNIRIDFDTVDGAKKFWDKFIELIKENTTYKKKEYR